MGRTEMTKNAWELDGTLDETLDGTMGWNVGWRCGLTIARLQLAEWLAALKKIYKSQQKEIMQTHWEFLEELEESLWEACCAAELFSSSFSVSIGSFYATTKQLQSIHQVTAKQLLSNH